MIQQEAQKRRLRRYEASVWSLQDDFITVLKAAGVDNKGQIQEPNMSLNVDGTQELSFKIPMYLNINGIKQENPGWYNYTNGILIANMRKIKIILNKGTNSEEIHEFLITKVTETHEKNELMCSVECEGLAFHELGKVGYKVSLSQDDFYNDDLDYFENGEWKDSAGVVHKEQPIANLQYWANKFLTPYPEDDTAIINSHVWYYQVQMDWSSYTQQAESEGGKKRKLRSSNKVYEDEYVGAWKEDAENNILIPKEGTVYGYVEKARLVDLKESNKYNLSQDLAEAFGIYCKYEYVHDKNYHIIARKVIFYNSFIEENKGAIDINYKYNTSSISREMDSSELVTKMFIKPVEDDSSASGYITIMDSDVNKMGEDYLFNFDYLYSIGAIDQAAYDYTKKYEVEMHNCNNELIPIQEKIVELELRKPEAEARKKIHETAIQLDQERIGASNELLNNLTDNTGKIVINSNPRVGILLKEKGSDTSYLNISDEGVIGNTIQIYADSNKTILIPKNWTLEYDEFDGICRINDIRVEGTSRLVYLTYEYEPRLYYEKIRQVWESRLARDEDGLDAAGKEVQAIENQLKTAKQRQEELLQEKAKLIADFETYLGPAVREGYWQPEDYTDYGDINISSFEITNTECDIDKYSSFIWDKDLFEDEQDITYKNGASENEVYYPIINISKYIKKISAHLNELSFLYYDFNIATAEPFKRRAMALGSLMQLGFVRLKRENEGNVIPVLILTGAEKLTKNELSYLTKTKDNLEETEENLDEAEESSDETKLILGVALGKLTTKTTENNKIEITEEYFAELLKEDFIDPTTVESVYPRIQINNMALKTSEDALKLKYKDQLLNNYEDYYVLSRTIDNTASYYITIKPETIIRSEETVVSPEEEVTTSSEEEAIAWSGKLDLYYTISNANTAIYLDALEVLKDSAYPQVSYEVDVTYAQIEYIQQVSKMLNRIVHINDNDLKFENVRGYVSVVNLDLDHPWNDSIEIKNYKTKFEDLFTKIVASSEQMKRNEYVSGMVSQAFSPKGEIKTEVLQDSVNNADLNYAFNNGNLTVSNTDGILGASDSGVVAFRGGGIFTATEKDSNGDWRWNTGILPSGINADLITTGQIDTNRIRIYAGDQLRFQWNKDGLFAYKSYTDNNNANNSLLNPDEYVKFNEDGLTLVKPITTSVNGTSTTTEIKRVSLDWEGLILRNYDNIEVFKADADTGDLIITGMIQAKSGYIGGETGWVIDNNSIHSGGIKIDDSGISGDGLYLFSNATDTGIKLYQDDNLIGYLGTPLNESGNNVYFKVGDDTNYLKYYQRYINNAATSELEVSGQITATSGKIANWKINENSLGTASSFSGTGTYLGVDGISFGKGFQVFLKENNNKERIFDSLIVGAVNDDNDYIMKIGRNSDAGQFELDLRGVTIAEGSLPSSIRGLAGKVYWTTFYENNEPIFDENAPLGSLGVLYTESIVESSQAQSLNAAASPNSAGYLPTAGYGEAGHNNATYFNKKYNRWNVSRGSQDGYYVDNWSRAGIRGSKTNKSATYATLKVTSGLQVNNITVEFKYCLLPKNATWDTWSSGKKWGENLEDTEGISVQAFASIDENAVAITDATTFRVPSDKTTVTVGKVLDGSVVLNISESGGHTFVNNEVFYIAFYPSDESLNSLIYIDQNTVSIGKGAAVQQGQIGLYIKTATSNDSSTWQKVFYTTYGVENNNSNNSSENENESEANNGE